MFTPWNYSVQGVIYLMTIVFSSDHFATPTVLGADDMVETISLMPLAPNHKSMINNPI